MAISDNTLRYIAAGFQRMDFAVLDADGLPAGITGTVTPNDANGVACGRIKLAKTLNITTQAGEVVPITGDDIYAGGFVFDNVTPRSFDVEFAEDDFTDRQAFQDIVYQTKNNFQFAGRDIKPFNVNNCMFIGLSRAQSQMPGALGLPVFAGVYCGRAELTVRGRGTFAERAAASYLGTVNLNAMDAYAWGETFQVSEEGYVASFVQDWTSRMPPTVHRWKGLTTKSKIFLGELPASTDLSDFLLYSLDSNNRPTQITSGFTIDLADHSINFVAPHTSTNLICWYAYQPS